MNNEPTPAAENEDLNPKLGAGERLENASEVDRSGDPSEPPPEGPGWMPAVMAATVAMGIFGFLFCAFSTWLLFQQQTKLVVRTLEGTYIPSIEQSLMEPEEKKATVKLLEEFAKDIQRGKYENWQAGGVMTRLVRAPVLQWGELAAVEAFANKHPDELPDAAIQFSRVRQGVKLDQVTSIDVEDVLRPVLLADNSDMGRGLIDPLSVKMVADVVQRAKMIADRADVADQAFEPVMIDKIVEREIKSGILDGSR